MKRATGSIIISGCIMFLALIAFATLASTRLAQSALLTKATELFGEPLSTEHHVYQLTDDYVLWLILDTCGELVEADVRPKAYYSSELLNASRPSQAAHLSRDDYEAVLGRISQLRNIGALRIRHEGALPSDFGPLNTDQFEAAFVDRIVTNDRDQVVRFNVYFLRDQSGSPEQLETLQGQPMVCLVGIWYYAKAATSSETTVGQWQTMQIAGPNLHGIHGCHRSTVLHDADGFMIEEPQNETIVVAAVNRVRAIQGQVTIDDRPLAEANVEVLRAGERNILRCTTDEKGHFRIPNATEGEYKFKITKDGFKALSGKIALDHNAPEGTLSFGMHLGT